MIKTMKGLAQTETKALQSGENTTQGDYQITKISRVARRTTIHCFLGKKEARGPQWRLSSLRIKKSQREVFFHGLQNEAVGLIDRGCCGGQKEKIIKKD